MPTIEIISINQLQPSPHDHFTFAVEAESVLRSHRNLWQSRIDTLAGCIYHLGNPKLKTSNGIFFASELLTDRFLEDAPFLEFVHAHTPGVRELLAEAVRCSPQGSALFLSDWQFGPDRYEHPEEVTLEQFWKLHDEQGVRLNALYRVREAAS